MEIRRCCFPIVGEDLNFLLEGWFLILGLSLGSVVMWMHCLLICGGVMSRMIGIRNTEISRSSLFGGGFGDCCSEI